MLRAVKRPLGPPLGPPWAGGGDPSGRIDRSDCSHFQWEMKTEPPGKIWTFDLQT